MGQFFKFLTASCLGVFLAMILLFGLGTAIIAGIASSAENAKDIKPNSVLHLKFDESIPEKTNNLEFSPFDFNTDKVLGLQEILRTLEKAREDDRIKGIFLELDQVPSGFVTSSILRDALNDFLENDKFVVAYSKYYSQGAYYLASVSDKVYINPSGMLDFRGFAAQIPFFKDMLDRVGINMLVVYAGKFKSATEPYRRNDMSEENRIQLRAYIDDIYQQFLNDISESRGLSTTELHRIADGYLAHQPADALQLGIVDAVGYQDEALDDLRERLSLDEDEKIPMIDLNDYNQSNPQRSDYTTRDKIAIIYAEGAIVDGKGENGNIGDKKYVDIIREVRRSDRIKAIVLRVNSPGGSVMASDNIFRELNLARAAGKPVVVSMGDYAASGGYYISMGADSILAEPNTLTGSIGVYGTFPNLSVLSNEKLGIHWDTVKTGRFATGLNPFIEPSEGDKQMLQRMVDQVYETFLTGVSEGRGMSRDSVHAIAQGRVWTGQQALRLGLVDRLGSLDDAIASAAGLADLEKYRVTEYPRTKDPLQQFLEDLMKMETTSAETALLRSQLGEWYPFYQEIKDMQEARGVMARLPFLIPYN